MTKAKKKKAKKKSKKAVKKDIIKTGNLVINGKKHPIRVVLSEKKLNVFFLFPKPKNPKQYIEQITKDYNSTFKAKLK